MRNVPALGRYRYKPTKGPCVVSVYETPTTYKPHDPNGHTNNDLGIPAPARGKYELVKTGTTVYHILGDQKCVWLTSENTEQREKAHNSLTVLYGWFNGDL